MTELLSAEPLHSWPGQGAVLGKVLLNASTGGAGATHSQAQARVAYAAASALSGDSEPLPAGLSPHVARLLAGYIVDVQRTWYGSPDRRRFTRPAGTYEESRDRAGARAPALGAQERPGAATAVSAPAVRGPAGRGRRSPRAASSGPARRR
ncbi:hypothetical protein [Streptomyces sp. NBC_00829]|uniref:hypothetical protein n=1 Tax=Streptomyces sp. NBC_00829 TaxID=2903679 RepID=UPI00386870D0|nr:hypothetical protein OG293_22635 [Streptomyces sp. NBC_00829]